MSVTLSDPTDDKASPFDNGSPMPDFDDAIDNSSSDEPVTPTKVTNLKSNDGATATTPIHENRTTHATGGIKEATTDSTSGSTASHHDSGAESGSTAFHPVSGTEQEGDVFPSQSSDADSISGLLKDADANHSRISLSPADEAEPTPLNKEIEADPAAGEAENSDEYKDSPRGVLEFPEDAFPDLKDEDGEQEAGDADQPPPVPSVQEEEGGVPTFVTTNDPANQDDDDATRTSRLTCNTAFEREALEAQLMPTTSSDQNDEQPGGEDTISNNQIQTTPESDTEQSEAERLNCMASDLLSRGRDEEALEAYGKAMHVARADMMRVKRLIQRRSIQNRNKSSKSAEDKQLNVSLNVTASTIADIRNNMGVVYEMRGDYDSAISCCNDALDVYKNTCHRSEETDPAVQRTMKNLMQMEMARDTSAERKSLHQYADKLTARIPNVTNPQAKRGIRGDVLNTLRTALNLERESLGKNHPQVAETLLKIGLIHCGSGNVDSALRQMNAAIMILRSSLGRRHPKLGMALMTVASIYDDRQPDEEGAEETDKDRALDLYGEAVVVLRATLGDVHPKVGATLNNMGVIHFNRLSYDDALRVFGDALVAYGSEGDPSERHHNSVYVWNNIGEIHTRRGDWEDGLSAYSNALALLLRNRKRIEQRAKEERSTGMLSGSLISIGGGDNAGSSKNISSTIGREMTANERMIADAQKNVAVSNASLGRYSKAMEAYGEALKIYRRFEAKLRKRRKLWRNENPSRAKLSKLITAVNDVAGVLQTMGEVQECAGNLDAAMKLYTEALELRRENICPEEGEGDNVDVAILLGGIGSIHTTRGEYDEAVVLLKEALSKFEAHGLTDDHTAYRETKQRLQEAQKGSDDNLSRSSQSASMAQSSTSTPASQSAQQQDFAETLDERAESFCERGDYDRALLAYADALKIRRSRIVASSNGGDGGGGDSSPARRVAETNGIAKTLANIARVHVKRRDYEEAQVLYQKAAVLYRANGVEEDHPRITEITKELAALNA